MSTAIQIILALLILNVLVIIHELGHFISARLSGIQVNEFAIGMGPAILKKEHKGTIYALRAFPIGGFVAMEGEDEESASINAFGKKPVWKRMIVVVAGAVMNLLLGLLLTFILVLRQAQLPSTVIGDFDKDATSVKSGLQIGDKLLKMDSTSIQIYSDVVYYLARNEDGVSDILVERDGKKVLLSDVKFDTEVVQKLMTSKRDFYFTPESKTILTVAKHTVGQTFSFVKVIYYSLYDLFRGKYSLDDISGPVGTVTVIGQTIGQTKVDGINPILYLAAFITINLGIFNLLPLPALDGGRFLFLLVEAIRRKPINQKYEGMVHFAGFALLILLIVIVTFNDIKNLIFK